MKLRGNAALVAAACLLVAACGSVQGSTQVAVRNFLGADVIVVFYPATGDPAVGYEVKDGTMALTLVAQPGWRGRAVAFIPDDCAVFAETTIGAPMTQLEVAGDGGFGVATSFDPAEIDARPPPISPPPC